MKTLHVQDVLELLLCEIDRVGGQSEWSRQTGIDRAQINRALNRRRLPPSQLCRALGLEWVVVRHVAREEDQTKFVIVSNRDVLQILSKAINQAGGLTAWSRQIGVNRTYLSLVLHERKSPGKRILAALNLSEVLVRANKSSVETRNRLRQNGAPEKRLPHARWE